MTHLFTGRDLQPTYIEVKSSIDPNFQQDTLGNQWLFLVPLKGGIGGI